MKHAHPVALVSFAALAFALGCSAKTEAPASADQTRDHDGIRLDPGNPHLNFVKIEAIQPTDAAPSVRLTGKVTFDENHTQRVASPIDGRATKMLVELGDKVKPGQALVELTSPHVSELQAEAQKTAQDLGLAEKGLERARKLKLDGAVSEKEAAQAEADYRKAKADAARTEAQLRSLSVSATDPTVSAALRAQIGGTVVDRNVLVGQEVRADSALPLMTISDLSTVWVQADVYEQDLGLVSNGATVKIHVPAYPDEAFDGKVEHVGDVVDPASRTVKLRCSVPNPGNRLKPEMFAKIELMEAPGQKVLVVPTRAIITNADGARVIVASEGNVFRERSVNIGPEVDEKVRILSGLRPGERVVTDGAIFVKREMESD
jgi:membrane fusion protein, heavy metal efflux system